MIKRMIALTIFIGLLMASSLVTAKVGGTGTPGDILSQNSFIDDVGNKIVLETSVTKIVSLSPVHTENLYTIGAENLLIGVDESSNFPYETQLLPTYRLNKKLDQALLVERQPDVVLIDPNLSASNSALVGRLETEGIMVVALMPESLDDFGYYMTKLGMITGRGDAAAEAAQKFKDGIAAYERDYEEQPGVFVEATEKGYYTPTEGSLVAEAVRLAGGHQIMPKKSWYDDESDVLKVGEAYIGDNNDQIDLYLTLQGDGYSGATIVSMKQKPVFKSLEVMKTERIYEIESPFLARYTLRYVKGLKELNRLFYRDQMSLTKGLNPEDPLTRINVATIIYETLTLPTYVLNDKDYYTFEKYHHTYGSFEDVHWYEEDFDIIETVVMKAYLLPLEKDDAEWFARNQPMTQEDIEHFMTIWKDLKGEDLHKVLSDHGIQLESLDTVGEFNLLLEVMTTWQ